MTSELTMIPHEMANIKASKTVGLIADTHVPARAKCIPKMVFKIFENVNFIVHAGDLVQMRSGNCHIPETPARWPRPAG